ncbi:MAG TPA: phosphatase PAP2 family protein [Candidatus Cloacimonadota bacterium]|nr:phosphatase PAP2 family protein [Candidatus Cloacimonadota bacterium]
MQGRICLLLLIFVLCATTVQAQDSSYLSSYLISYPQTVWQAATAPLEWDAQAWLTAGGVVAIGGILYLTDEQSNSFFQQHRTELTAEFSRIFKLGGEGKYILPGLGLTVASGLLFDSPKTADTGLLCLKSFILANGVSQVLKYSTQRQRPRHGKGKEFWNGSGFTRHRQSFPSGHSTVAWSLAPILAEQYREAKWVAPVVYTFAAGTSLSRVHDNEHWLSDAFAGAVIGYITAKLTLVSTPRLEVYPNAQLDGVTLLYRY